MVNQELFTEFLRVYAFQPATAFWRAVEVDILRKFIPASGTCLDLGCGDGKLTVILFKKTSYEKLTIIGIDSDEYETRQAAQFPFYERIHTCSASKIPEETGKIDHIISNSVLEHIPDIEAVIAEVARLLKTGGSFAFTVPSPGFHICLHGPFNKHVSRETYLQEMDKRLAHYRYWNAEEWQMLLTNHDLKIEKEVEYFNCREVRRWESLSRFTAGILYALAGQRNTPIEIQKRLGLRKTQSRLILPRWLARLLAGLLSAGIKDSPVSEQKACLLILARKIS